MGGTQAKQFLELAGIPIIFHTLKPFEKCDAVHEIILVLPANHAAGFLSLADKYGIRKVSKVVPGGATRAESVWRGLQAVRPTTAEIIAVHDGVRPFVTVVEITEVIKAAELNGAAILVTTPTDTLKHVLDGKVVSTLNRRDLRHALTPQCFRYSLLRRAFEQADLHDPEITDESFLVERLGEKVVTVEGSAVNIKITGPQDLAMGEALLSKS